MNTNVINIKPNVVISVYKPPHATDYKTTSFPPPRIPIKFFQIMKVINLNENVKIHLLCRLFMIMRYYYKLGSKRKNVLVGDVFMPMDVGFG